MPAIIALVLKLLPSLIQAAPSAINAMETLIALLKSGTGPTDDQIAQIEAQFDQDEQAALAAIAAAGGTGVAGP